MFNEFAINYKMKYKHNKEDFNSLMPFNTAYIIADDDNSARAKLVNEFPMFDIEITGSRLSRTMTENEYLNG